MRSLLVEDDDILGEARRDYLRAEATRGEPLGRACCQHSAKRCAPRWMRRPTKACLGSA